MKVTGTTRTVQNKANQAYKELEEAVNALVLVNGEISYAEFIDLVNTQIKELKTVAKMRATINAKKRKEKEGEPAKRKRRKRKELVFSYHPPIEK